MLGGGVNSPLLQNLVITREELSSLAATLGLPASLTAATSASSGLDASQLIQQSLAETKVGII